MLLPEAAPDATSAPLVLDSEEPLPRLFRSPAEAPPLPPGVDSAGFADLRCSGSAQFSRAGFDALRARLGHPAAAALHVVDLREESHGFLNGAAISWYAQHNWGSVGLTADEAAGLEALRLALLARSPTVLVANATRVKRGEPPEPATWARETVASEREALALPEGRYLRLPVTDHVRPRDEVVDRFIHFVRGLDEDAHVHYHCRGGKGRTTTFLLLHDMLRSAATVSSASLFARHAALGGSDPARRPDPASWKAPYLLERLAFTERFYQYAAANPRGRAQTWTAWLAAAGTPHAD